MATFYVYCGKCDTENSVASVCCASCGATLAAPNQYLQYAGTGRIPAGEILHQRYRVLEKVGQGGMGAVYAAQDTQLGDRLVAIKELSMSRLSSDRVEQGIEQFKQEALLLAGLNHPNLPHIYEYFGQNERWYLVMSFIQGETLQAYLDKMPDKKLPVEEVVRIGIELCNVLEYLHTHQPQIIFRDLKPLNVMITPEKQIYLIDFGIARHFKINQTKDTNFYYSVGYAPPEQYGQSQTGPRSDIYSLGVTLQQMLSGYNPASKPFDFPALDPSIPVPLTKLITQMLELKEQERPASVTVVKHALERVGKTSDLPETEGVNYDKEYEKTEPYEKKGTSQITRAASSSSLLTLENSLRIFFSTCALVAGIILTFNNHDGLRGLSFDYGNPISTMLAVLGIVIILIGLVFLLPIGHRVINLIKGIGLLGIGNLLFFLIVRPFGSWSGYYSFYLWTCTNSDQNHNCISYAYQPFNILIFGILGLIACMFLTALGFIIYQRWARPTAGSILGGLQTILGVAFVIQLNNRFFPAGLLNLPLASGIFMTVLGIILVTITLGRKGNYY